MKGTNEMRSEILDLRSGLIGLGVKGTVTVKWITTDRIAVYVNGEYFGVWDTTRKNFVD